MTAQNVVLTPQTAQTSAVRPHYAGFWIRAGAFILDNIFISLPVWILSVPLIGYALFRLAPFLDQPDQSAELPPEAIAAVLVVYGLGFLLQIIWMLLFWLYFAMQESGPKQATWGKRIFGLRVTDADGKRLSFSRASGRAFAKFLSYLTLCIGFMMAGWTKKKQALHDFIADTAVIKNC